MAMKAILFLFTYSLLVAMRVSSVEEDRILTEVFPPKKAPEYAPKPHPVKAPWYPPVKAPWYPPTIARPPAQYSAPVKAPAYPPTMADHKHYPGCSHKCVQYCNGKASIHKKRWCQRICTECCSKTKCLPGGATPCNGWTQIIYHGNVANCP